MSPPLQSSGVERGQMPVHAGCGDDVVPKAWAGGPIANRHPTFFPSAVAPRTVPACSVPFVSSPVSLVVPTPPTRRHRLPSLTPSQPARSRPACLPGHPPTHRPTDGTHSPVTLRFLVPCTVYIARCLNPLRETSAAAIWFDGGKNAFPAPPLERQRRDFDSVSHPNTPPSHSTLARYPGHQESNHPRHRTRAYLPPPNAGGPRGKSDSQEARDQISRREREDTRRAWSLSCLVGRQTHNTLGS